MKVEKISRPSYFGFSLNPQTAKPNPATSADGRGPIESKNHMNCPQPLHMCPPGASHAGSTSTSSRASSHDQDQLVFAAPATETLNFPWQLHYCSPLPLTKSCTTFPSRSGTHTHTQPWRPVRVVSHRPPRIVADFIAAAAEPAVPLSMTGKEASVPFPLEEKEAWLALGWQRHDAQTEADGTDASKCRYRHHRRR